MQNLIISDMQRKNVNSLSCAAKIAAKLMPIIKALKHLKNKFSILSTKNNVKLLYRRNYEIPKTLFRIFLQTNELRLFTNYFVPKSIKSLDQN